MKLELLEKHIFELENQLLKPETRQSAAGISELLADDFMEFCISGNVYHYNKGDIIDKNVNSPEIKWEIKEFAIRQLSKESILATYKVTKYSGSKENIKYSLRSSIWQCLDGKWRMVFHQGTLTSQI